MQTKDSDTQNKTFDDWFRENVHDNLGEGIDYFCTGHASVVFKACWQAALLSRAACGEFEAIEKEIDKHAGCWAIANKRDSAFEDFKMGALWFKANAEKFLAGQKSKAATLRLPEYRDSCDDNLSGMTMLEIRGWNDCLDAVKSMNEGDGE